MFRLFLTANLLALFLVTCNNKAFQSNHMQYIQYVDPFLGSVHCRWFFLTPASVPMGMAKLAPHTNAHYGNQGGWEPVGYDYRHTSIEGFGHFHEFQIGGLVIMPIVGELKTSPGDIKDVSSGYRSTFKKESEIAQPGYYKVFLDDYEILSELTATERVGFHRYQFPSTTKAKIIFDIGRQQGESGPVKESSIQYCENGEIEGSIISNPVYVQNYHPGCDVRMYFVISLSKHPDSWGIFKENSVHHGDRKAEKNAGGLYLNFDTQNDSIIELKAGLSFTSIDNARENLYKEGKRLEFDQAKAKALSKWNKMLGRIEVSGGSDADLIKFYTGLYHTLLGRGISNDVNGSYPLPCGEIGQAPLDENGNPEYNIYNSDATWGSFWNIQQVWALAYPEIFSDYIKSHLKLYEDYSWLPDGIAAGCLVPGVPSNFMSVAIASAWNHGIQDFDGSLGYEAALKNEIGWENRPIGVGKYDVKKFVQKGFISNDVIWRGWKFSSSHTLEYCFSAYAVSQLAKTFGYDNDYQKLIALAGGYKNLFDKSIGFMRPVNRDGSFVEDFTPEMVWNGFQEGNSWQYSWYVPHDINGLMNLMGRDRFCTRLDSIFNESKKLEFGGGKQLHSFSGLEAVYNHGNQPSLHISYLFNYAGKPWLTQKWTREICNIFYGTTPVHGYGYGQDEDQGQLGAWYVLASIGMFDVQGGSNKKPTWQLTSPLFDRIVINLNQDYYNGKSFKITVDRESSSSIYINKAELNGNELKKPWFSHRRVIQGGNLKLSLTDKPNYDWGVNTQDQPPSMSE